MTKILHEEAMLFEGPSFEPSAEDIPSIDSKEKIWVNQRTAYWKVLKPKQRYLKFTCREIREELVNDFC